MTKPVGKLFIISGPSQVGKNAIATKLARFKKLNLLKIVTTTTRPRRPDDKSAIYHFVSENQFKKMIREGKFLEWAKVHMDYYGTPRRAVTSALQAGFNVILVIDVQGAQQVKKIIPDVITLFITAESKKELKRRIFESKHIPLNQKPARWRSMIKELAAAKGYDHMIINRWGKLPQTVRQVKTIINRYL